MLFAATSSSLGSGAEQIFVGVLILVISGVLAWIAKKVTERLEDIKTAALATSTKVDNIEGVLITPGPTPLVPDPPKGLVDIVRDHTKSIATLLSGTAELVADKVANSGSTSRDAIDRTEKIVVNLQKETVRVAENLAHEEERHHDESTDGPGDGNQS